MLLSKLLSDVSMESAYRLLMLLLPEIRGAALSVMVEKGRVPFVQRLFGIMGLEESLICIAHLAPKAKQVPSP